MTIQVKVLDSPKLREPVLICGLPGSGYVAKIAVDFLVSELKASPLATIYSYSFPPQVLIRSDGSAELTKHEMAYVLGQSQDLILYTGDAQPVNPEAEYELSNKVLDLAEGFGVRRVFTLAAYITGQFVKTPRVFGTATNHEFLKMLIQSGANVMSEGTITGMNGLIIGLAALRGMVGACLLGETSGYVMDPKASHAVLSILKKVLGLEVNLAPLEERARQGEVLRSILESMRKSTPEPQPEKDLGYIS
ncbi:MAG: proteasome assembly chaperone family protein [Nitrososphaerales archaeon]